MGLEENVGESDVSQMPLQDPDEMRVMALVWFCGGQRLKLCEIEAITTMLPVDRGGFDGLTETDVHVAVEMVSVVVNFRAEEGRFDCVELRSIQLHAVNLKELLLYLPL